MFSVFSPVYRSEDTSSCFSCSLGLDSPSIVTKGATSSSMNLPTSPSADPPSNPSIVARSSLIANCTESILCRSMLLSDTERVTDRGADSRLCRAGRNGCCIDAERGMVCDCCARSCHFGDELSRPIGVYPPFLAAVASVWLDDAAANDPSFIRGDVPSIRDREIGIPLGTFPAPGAAVRLEGEQDCTPAVACMSIEMGGVRRWIGDRERVSLLQNRGGGRMMRSCFTSESSVRKRVRATTDRFLRAHLFVLDCMKSRQVAAVSFDRETSTARLII